jgi:hypothetical protein
MWFQAGSCSTLAAIDLVSEDYVGFWFFAALAVWYIAIDFLIRPSALPLEAGD